MPGQTFAVDDGIGIVAREDVFLNLYESFLTEARYAYPRRAAAVVVMIACVTVSVSMSAMIGVFMMIRRVNMGVTTAILPVIGNLTTTAYSTHDVTPYNRR